MSLIGITGRKYHGKDTVAQEVARQNYAIVRFADPLKAMLRAFYETHGVTSAVIDRKLEGDLKEHPCPLLRGKTPRYAMQTLGDEWGRQLIAKDLWTESHACRSEQFEKVVVPDVRYENEVAEIKRRGGVVWRVDASQRVGSNDLSGHASEMTVDRLVVDVEIDNNGSAFELTKAVQVALSVA